MGILQGNLQAIYEYNGYFAREFAREFQYNGHFASEFAREFQYNGYFAREFAREYSTTLVLKPK